jgi:alanine dehydrogenase
MRQLILGFPRMHVESGEKRDFTPALFAALSRHEHITIVLEEGYGNKLGFSENDYRQSSDNLSFADYSSVLASDIVTIVRTPKTEDLLRMRSGSILFSMLHFPTHQQRNKILRQQGIHGISMDSLTDDFGQRYIQDFEGTATSALNQAFTLWKSLGANDRSTVIRVTILGTGGLGRIAANVAAHYAGAVLAAKPSVVVTSLGRNATCNSALMKQTLAQTDILVDTTLRHTTSNTIIPNAWIALLPEHAVITDITADDYDTSVDPVQVKAIEGIPTGSLDQTIFLPDDKAWDALPAQVSTLHRRPVVSCYSWPGVDPMGCIRKYENQMKPFLDLMIGKYGLAASWQIDLHSYDPFERAIARGSGGFAGITGG